MRTKKEMVDSFMAYIKRIYMSPEINIVWDTITVWLQEIDCNIVIYKGGVIVAYNYVDWDCNKLDFENITFFMDCYIPVLANIKHIYKKQLWK